VIETWLAILGSSCLSVEWWGIHCWSGGLVMETPFDGLVVRAYPKESFDLLLHSSFLPLCPVSAKSSRTPGIPD